MNEMHHREGSHNPGRSREYTAGGKTAAPATVPRNMGNSNAPAATNAKERGHGKGQRRQARYLPVAPHGVLHPMHTLDPPRCDKETAGSRGAAAPKSSLVTDRIVGRVRPPRQHHHFETHRLLLQSVQEGPQCLESARWRAHTE